eukprot:4394671-Amphidinium_carterae.1
MAIERGMEEQLPLVVGFFSWKPRSSYGQLGGVAIGMGGTRAEAAVMINDVVKDQLLAPGKVFDACLLKPRPTPQTRCLGCSTERDPGSRHLT